MDATRLGEPICAMNGPKNGAPSTPGRTCGLRRLEHPKRRRKLTPARMAADARSLDALVRLFERLHQWSTHDPERVARTWAAEAEAKDRAREALKRRLLVLIDETRAHADDALGASGNLGGGESH